MFLINRFKVFSFFNFPATLRFSRSIYFRSNWEYCLFLGLWVFKATFNNNQVYRCGPFYYWWRKWCIMRKPHSSKTINPITCIEYTSLAGIELTPWEMVLFLTEYEKLLFANFIIFQVISFYILIVWKVSFEFKYIFVCRHSDYEGKKDYLPLITIQLTCMLPLDDYHTWWPNMDRRSRHSYHFYRYH